MDPVIEAAGPEADVPAADTPEVSTPETGTQEAQPQVPEDAPAPQPDEVAVYQDVVAKYNQDPTYEMTDAESDAFLSVQDKVNNGHMEEPPLKSTEEKPPEGDKKEGEPETPNTDPKPEPEDTGEKEPKVTDSVADSMMKAMEKVGAKDVTELPEKIGLLQKKMSESGGKLGTENAALKESLADLKQKAVNHSAWLEDLRAGKPEALEYLQKDLGVDLGKVSTSTPSSSASIDDGGVPDGLLEDIDPDDFVDDKLARLVKGLQNVVKQQSDTIKTYADKTKEVTQEALTREAVTGWTDDVVRLVTNEKNQKAYGLSATEARGLAEQYFDKKQKDSPIHPKFQKVHELIVYAHKNNMPNLDTAHVMLQHETGAYAHTVVDAIKKGQQSVNHPVSVNTDMSEKQSRGGNDIPEPAITDDVMDKIEKGNFDAIPDHWMDDQGNLIPEKVPQRFHDRAFGRAGKPK